MNYQVTEIDIRAADRAISKFRKIGESRHKSKHEDRHVNGHKTAKEYEYVLRKASAFCREHGTKLPYISPELAYRYLEKRSTEVQQKQLNNERRALTLHMKQTYRIQQIVKKTREEFKLDYVASQLETSPKESRSYTAQEVIFLTSRMEPELALSTKIAYAAGLRTEELLTIRRVEDQPISKHRADNYRNENMFFGNRSHWNSYTVLGKGGLIREIRLPESLSTELENRRIPEERRVAKQNRLYESKITSHYRLIGGVKFSQEFKKAAEHYLGFCNGAHGLRHSYAQERLASLQNNGLTRSAAKGIVSLELGHFRDEITEDYLR